MHLTIRLCLYAGILMIASPALATLKVVTTLPDYGALIRVLGGQHVQVRVLASPFEDPHYVEAKPSFIVALNRADLLITNGLEQEIGWLPPLLVQARNPKIQPGQAGFLEIARLITNRLDLPLGTIDRSMGDIHAGGNPHFYYDPVRMASILPTLTARLVHLDPEHKADFEKNLLTQQEKFTVFIKRLKTTFGGLSEQRRQVVVYHRSLSYLFETLGFKAVAYLEPKPGIPPTPSHVAKVLGLMKRRGIKTIIQEAHYPSKTGQTLAKLVGGKLIVIAGGTKEGQTYLAHLEEITTQLLIASEGGAL